MTEINVITLSETAFQVTVNAKSQTAHEVKVSAEYARQLTGGRIITSQLVHASFEFLLAREPNTSILRSFDLSVIAKYFPDYETAMKTMTAQSAH